MTKHIRPSSFRGVTVPSGVRADAQVLAVVEKMNTAWAAFQTANDERLKGVEARFDDVVKREEVDRVNAAISEATDMLNKIVERQKAMETEGAAASGEMPIARAAAEFGRVASVRRGDKEVDAVTVEDYRAYQDSFEAYARRGDHGIKSDVRAALQVGSDKDGGYLVPVDSTGRIITKIFETSDMRRVANVVSVGTDTYEGPIDRDEASCGWVGEKTARTETDTPEIGKWVIPVFEMYAMPYVTQKILDDAGVDIAAWLETKVADKMTRTENTAFFTGDGVEKPRGVLQYPTAATADDSRAWGTFEHVISGSTSAINNTDFLINLVYSLKRAYRNGAAWGMNRKTVAEVRKLKDGQNNYLWQPNFSERQGGTLLGYGIEEFEDMPDIASNSLSIAFGDWNAAYTIVDRLGLTMIRDNLTTKGYVKFYFRRRVGGAAQDFEALKFMKFTT